MAWAILEEGFAVTPSLCNTGVTQFRRARQEFEFVMFWGFNAHFRVLVD
jgi:hypothetical protein